MLSYQNTKVSIVFMLEFDQRDTVILIKINVQNCLYVYLSVCVCGRVLFVFDWVCVWVSDWLSGYEK